MKNRIVPFSTFKKKGIPGLKDFLKSNGSVVPTDSNGTPVTTYMRAKSGYDTNGNSSAGFINTLTSVFNNIANKLNAFLNGINSFFQGKDDANFYTAQKGDTLAFKKIILFVAFTVLMIYNISSSYALEIIKTPSTINYIDLNNDGAKDMVVVGVYATEMGGYLNYVYSFYLKQDKSNYFIVPIIDNGYEYTAIAASKAVNCSESGNDITYISTVRIIKNRGKVFLLIAEKKKPEGDESIYLTKEKFQFKVYVLEKGDVVWTFKKYKMQESRGKYCDANDAFSKELKFIDLGGQPK
ncbi:hypothetical protein A45J_0649 [hot springs metagenome]|uniref:Uncharacterized protein n=1 Tax=hot springs metagenome TaxID=433727 RepID=A0A5J4KTD7_9ZZZZ